MQLQSYEFQGQALPLIHIDGRPAWLARDVGRVLGYSDDGKRLTKIIGERWSNELMEGIDYIRVEGQQLADLKATLRLSLNMGPSHERSATPSLHSRTPSVTILYQSGLNLVCLLSKKPLGRELRRWLVDEVLPALAAGEGIPAASPSSDQQLKDLRSLASLQLKAGLKKEAQRTVKLAAHLTAPDLFSYQEAQAMVPKGPPRYVLEALAEVGLGQPAMSSHEWFVRSGGRLLPQEKQKAGRSASVAMSKLLSSCEDIEFQFMGQTLVIQRESLRDEKGRIKIGWRVASSPVTVGDSIN